MGKTKAKKSVPSRAAKPAVKKSPRHAQFDLAISLSAVQELEAGLRLCLESALAVSRLDCGGIYLVDEENGSLRLAVHTGLSPAFIADASHYGPEAPQSRIVAAGRPIHLLYNDLKVPKHGATRDEGLRFLAVLPVLHRGRAIACLNAASHTRGRIGPEERRGLEAVAGEIGGAIARLKAEEDGLRSEERYRRLLESTSDCVSVVSPDQRLLIANRAMRRFLGLPEKESAGRVEGRPVRELFPRYFDSPRMKEVLAAFQKRESHTLTLPYDFNGRRGWFEARLDPVPEGTLCILRDITAAKQADQELLDKESRFRTLFETTQDSIFIIDQDSRRILAANPAASRLYGYTAEEFLSLKNSDLSAEPEKTRQAVDEESTHVPLRYHRKKDGTVFPVEISGGYFQQKGRRLHTAYVRDISERIIFEEMIEKDRQELQLIIDSSPIIIFYKGRDGRFVRVNQLFADALRKTKSDFIGKTVFELYSPVVARSMAKDDQEVINSGRPKFDIIERYESAEGERWVQTAKIPILDKDGTAIGLIGFAQDITERRRAEAAVQRSESRFRALIENSSDAISLIAPDGRVMYDSPSYSRLLGYSTEERVGKNTLDLVHPDDRPRIQALLADIMKERGRVDLPPCRVRHASGAWRWIEGVAQNLISEPSVGAIVVNFRDITERRAAQEAVKQNETRFRDLADLLPQVVYEATLDGIVTYVNRKAFELFGYGPEEIEKGFDLTQVVVPEDRWRVRQAIPRILGGAKTRGAEYTALRQDGTTFPVLLYSTLIITNGRPSGLRGLVVDISEQKKMEKELAETKAMLETAIIDTPIPMVLATAPECRIQMANDAALELLGIENVEKTFGKSFFEHEQTWSDFDPQGNHVPFSELPLSRAFRGEVTKSSLYYVRRKDGTVRWEMVSASPIRDQAGNLIAAFVVFPDVTEQVRAAQDLERRLHVEQLAAEISADFVNVGYDGIDAAITQALKKTTLHAGARAGELYLLADDHETVTNTHEWCVAPEESQLTQSAPAGLGEYDLEVLLRNRPVVISRPADRPAAAERERAGFRPYLLTPLFRSGELIGAVGVYGEPGRESDWPDPLVVLVGLIGDMIVNLLDRKQAEAELHIYREHLEELVAQRTEELENSRTAAVKLMETATAQRRRAEEALEASTRIAAALQESQTRLRLATKSASIGIVETDLAAQEITWDETCAKIHGLPSVPSVNLSRYYNEIIHPADRDGIRMSWEEAQRSQTGHRGREYRIIRPDGEVRWITEDHFIIRDDSGAAVRLVGAVQDVTEHKRTEEQIKRSLAEKETLIREIHHRVKNNLNTISNLIYFQAKIIKDRQAVSAFRDSQNRIQSMARIHEHLYRSWDLTTVDMKAYLSDLVVDLAQTYGVAGAGLELAAAAVKLDIDQAVPCGLIMNELVSNAMKYAFDKGRKNNKISVSLEADGDNFVLSVADNGIGLPAGWSVEQTDSLGIRLVNMFRTQLGGKLDVTSAPDAGTTFRIVFPRSRGKAAP